MPDETTTTTVESPAAPVSTPAPADVAGGGDALAAQLETLIVPAKRDGVEPAPEPKSDKVKPEAKPSKEPKQPEKQQVKEPEQKGKPEIADLNFAKLRKKVADIETEYSGFKNTATQEQEKLRRQIAVLESRKVLTPEHEQRLESIQKKLADAEAQLYSFDYSQSPEYKDKYATKWERTSAQAARDVAAMQVITGKDEETGKETYRQATVADWKRVYDAASKPEAWRVARELFGDQANIAMDHRNELKNIDEQAREEVQAKRNNYDKERSQREEQIGKFRDTHQKVSGEYDAELVTKYGTLFTGDPARPEEAQLVEKGQKFVDDALNAKDLSVEEHAKRSAVLRRWALSFPLMNDRLAQRDAKIAQLEEELSKFRKSDPGEATGEPTPTAQPKPDRGSDDLAKEFDEKLKI